MTRELGRSATEKKIWALQLTLLSH